MSAPLKTGTGKLGPGTLTIGQTGTELDVSCLLNNAAIETSKNVGDATTKLCGDQRPGTVTYTRQLTGSIDTDPGNAAGFFMLCWENPGTEQPFVFVPSTEVGATATGTLVIDPLRFGAGAYGEDLTSDIAFDIVGVPTITQAGP